MEQKFKALWNVIWTFLLEQQEGHFFILSMTALPNLKHMVRSISVYSPYYILISCALFLYTSHLMDVLKYITVI